MSKTRIGFRIGARRGLALRCLLFAFTVGGLSIAWSGPSSAQYGYGGSYGGGYDSGPPARSEHSARPPQRRSVTPRNAAPAPDSAAPSPPAVGVQSNRANSGVPPAGEQRVVPNEVLIELSGDPSPQVVDALANRHRLVRMESQNMGLSGTTYYRWRIPDGRSVSSVIRALEADPSIVSVQPNYVYNTQQSSAQQSSASGGDPAQYALNKLRLNEAHGVSTGHKVLVAVIDSGIDASHPELQGAIEDEFAANTAAEKIHSHGTGVAGIIAAHGRLRGAAPAVRILAVRAFGGATASAEGTTFHVLKGLNWATERGARIINMSFAGPFDPALARLIADARGKGAILIAASGNAGPKSPPLYPAADPNVIAVAATDADDKLFVHSSRGRYIAVAAPGVDIIAPAPGSTYQITTGTSVAAAQVSGIVALLLEAKPGLTPPAVRKALLATARDLGPKGRDDQFGAGLADAYGALQSLAASPARAPVANVSPAR
jgi:subtilisin family serine protease